MFNTIKDGAKVCEFLWSIDEAISKGRYDFNENLYVNLVSYETKSTNNFDGI